MIVWASSILKISIPQKILVREGTDKPQSRRKPPQSIQLRIHKKLSKLS